MSESVPNVVDIDQVIGPRLDRRIIVVEAHTSSGQIALRLSAGVAASLERALATALLASGGAELPSFLAADLPLPAASNPSQNRLRTFLKATRRGSAAQLKQAD